MRKFCKIFTCFALSAFLVFGSVNASYLRAKAAATGTLVAGYTIAEILAMLGVAISGTVILTEIEDQLGGDVPEHYFNDIDAVQSGLGTKLKEYCEIGKTLSPGDKLTMSEADFIEFRDFFANNPASNFDGSFGSNIESVSFLNSFLSDFAGFNTVSGDLSSLLNNYAGSTFQAITSINSEGVKTVMIGVAGSIHLNYYDWNPSNAYWLVGADARTCCIASSTSPTFVFSGSYPQVFKNLNESFGLRNVLSTTVSSYQDPVVSLPLVNGDYNILGVGRSMDANGVITGGISINMPLTIPLRTALENEAVAQLYNLMNVYPVSTASDTLLYYPSISAKGYEVEEKNTPSAVDFAPLNDLISGTNSKYTMDLSTFFPFCIPFDVYDFVAVFNAAPQAPVIVWKFPNGDGTFTDQTLDFSIFDPVARVFRTCELIAFCVGLAMITRSMFIRG